MHETGTRQGGSGSQHLPHSWSAPRTLVADHHRIALPDGLVEDGLQGLLFALEYPRRALVDELPDAHGFQHRAFLRKITHENADRPLGAHRILKEKNHVLSA